MFCADGQADGIWLNALVEKFFGGKLGMGRGGRVDNQAFDVGDIGKQGKNLQAVNKPVCRLYAAPDFKGKDGTASVWKIFLI